METNWLQLFMIEVPKYYIKKIKVLLKISAFSQPTSIKYISRLTRSKVLYWCFMGTILTRNEVDLAALIAELQTEECRILSVR